MVTGIEGNPWIRMWVEPRQTIRQIVNINPRSGFFFLSSAYGFPIALNLAQSLSLAGGVPLWAIIVGAVLCCPFLGMIGISISSWLLKVTGKWIGGEGTFLSVRAAVAWSNVPSFVNVLSWIALLAVFGSQSLRREFSDSQFLGYQSGVVFLVFLVQTVTSIWSFILLLRGLQEVQRFSIWRAFLNIVIPFVIVVCAVWVASLIVGGANPSVKTGI